VKGVAEELVVKGVLEEAVVRLAERCDGAR
jgi:hypothetical protein